MKSVSKVAGLACVAIAVCFANQALGQDDAGAVQSNSVVQPDTFVAPGGDINSNAVIQDGGTSVIQQGVIQQGGIQQGGIQQGGVVNYADGNNWNAGGDWNNGCCDNGVTYNGGYGGYGGYNSDCCHNHVGGGYGGGFRRASYGRPSYGNNNNCCRPTYGRRPIYGRR